jgi:hypothetical protein
VMSSVKLFTRLIRGDSWVGKRERAVMNGAE